MRSAGIWAAVLATITALASWSDSPGVDVSFLDVAANSGLSFVLKNHATPRKYQVETMPAGVAVLDYDNDGFDDLYFVNGASVPGLEKSGPADWNRLYRNAGNGTFSDVTERAGVQAKGYSMGVAAADYDNDGWTDLFVAGVNHNLLYRNTGKGTFVEVTRSAGLEQTGANKRWSVAAGWMDFDNDGLLDLFLVNYCVWGPDKDPFCGEPGPGRRTYCHPKHYAGLSNQLYRNNGDGTFTDVSQSSGIGAHIGKGMGVAFADYDADGRTDIFVANDTVRNFLFHNDGGGKFTEVSLRAGVAFNADGRALSSMGVDFRDIDNDGRPDLFITALTNETFTFYRNAGDGTFRDMTYASGLAVLTLPWGGWGTGIFDFNNDGFKDLFTANSDVMDNAELFSSRASKQPNQVYVNLGAGKFAEAAPISAPWRKPRAHRGSAFGDFDRDGRIDIAVTNLNEPVELLRNTSSPGQHWIEFLLTGRRSNRDAIGATLKLSTAAGPAQYNQVTTSVGYASSSSRRVHFGLGKETKATRVDIRWPSGVVQQLGELSADQVVRITEPE